MVVGNDLWGIAFFDIIDFKADFIKGLYAYPKHLGKQMFCSKALFNNFWQFM